MDGRVVSRPPRALVVAYYFPPLGGSGVARTLKVVRKLADAGWQPLVLTVDDAAWTRDPSSSSCIPPTVRSIRLLNPDWGRLARWARRGGPRRERRTPGRLHRWLVPDLHVGWSALATPVAAALAATRSVDLVYTTCPPYSANAAGVAARACGVPWAADFRDGWTCDPLRRSLPARRRALEQRLERAVLRRADRVFFASEAVRDHYCARLPELRERSDWILTGFEPSEFEPWQAVEPPRDRFEIAYAGKLLMYRSELLERVLAGLALWSRRDARVPDAARVRLVGAEREVRERVRAAGLEAWVRVEPGVPRGEVGRVLRRSHVALVLGSDGPGGGDPIPGKLFDAVGANRAVLAVTPAGTLARLVSRLGLGRVVPVDPPALAATLTTLHAQVERDGAVSAMPAVARSALRADLQMDRLVGRLEELLPGRVRPWASASVS